MHGNSSSNYVSNTPYPMDVDFTKMKEVGKLHPVDARGQYISPKPTSKRNRARNWKQ